MRALEGDFIHYGETSQGDESKFRKAKRRAWIDFKPNEASSGTVLQVIQGENMASFDG